MILLLIIFLQFLSIYLDNKTNIYDFFKYISDGTIATAYSNRGITLTISRSIFFIIPPLLGYLSIDNSPKTIANLLLFVSFFNFTITVIQFFYYSKIFNIIFVKSFLIFFKKIFHINILCGITAFSFFLITPYLLNYLAIIFPDHDLWIVQLNPALNGFLTLYVIWIFEPKIAKKIDEKRDYQDEFIEAFGVRLAGRFITFVIATILLV
jgi:hypothetical protein